VTTSMEKVVSEKEGEDRCNDGSRQRSKRIQEPPSGRGPFNGPVWQEEGVVTIGRRSRLRRSRGALSPPGGWGKASFRAKNGKDSERRRPRRHGGKPGTFSSPDVTHDRPDVPAPTSGSTWQGKDSKGADQAWGLERTGPSPLAETNRERRGRELGRKQLPHEEGLRCRFLWG